MYFLRCFALCLFFWYPANRLIAASFVLITAEGKSSLAMVGGISDVQKLMQQLRWTYPEDKIEYISDASYYCPMADTLAEVTSIRLTITGLKDRYAGDLHKQRLHAALEYFCNITEDGIYVFIKHISLHPAVSSALLPVFKYRESEGNKKYITVGRIDVPFLDFNWDVIKKLYPSVAQSCQVAKKRWEYWAVLKSCGGFSGSECVAHHNNTLGMVLASPQADRDAYNTITAIEPHLKTIEPCLPLKKSWTAPGAFNIPHPFQNPFHAGNEVLLFEHQIRGKRLPDNFCDCEVCVASAASFIFNKYLAQVIGLTPGLVEICTQYYNYPEKMDPDFIQGRGFEACTTPCELLVARAENIRTTFAQKVYDPSRPLLCNMPPQKLQDLYFGSYSVRSKEERLFYTITATPHSKFWVIGPPYNNDHIKTFFQKKHNILEASRHGVKIPEHFIIVVDGNSDYSSSQKQLFFSLAVQYRDAVRLISSKDTAYYNKIFLPVAVRVSSATGSNGLITAHNQYIEPIAEYEYKQDKDKDDNERCSIPFASSIPFATQEKIDAVCTITGLSWVCTGSSAETMQLYTKQSVILPEVMPNVQIIRYVSPSQKNLRRGRMAFIAAVALVGAYTTYRACRSEKTREILQSSWPTIPFACQYVRR